MSELYKRIEELCKENNVNITTMCKDSGASRASLSDLKMGRKQKLSADTLSKIAKYFNVSVDYLLGNVNDPFFHLDNERILSDINSYSSEDEKTPVLTAKDRRDIAKDLELMMEQLDSSGDLMFDGDPISDEARASIRNALQMGLEIAKIKNKERFTPKKYRKE